MFDDMAVTRFEVSTADLKKGYVVSPGTKRNTRLWREYGQQSKIFGRIRAFQKDKEMPMKSGKQHREAV